MAQGNNPTDAIIKAGYNVKNRKTASTLAVEVGRSKKVQDLIQRAGISDEVASKAVAHAMTDSVKPYYNSRTGELIDTWPDHLIRLKAVELFWKATGVLGNDRADRPQLPPSIKVQFIKVSDNTKDTVIKTIRPRLEK